MAQWREAVREDSFSRSTVFTHRRKAIAIFRLDDEIFAIDNVCSHEYSELSQGMVVGGDVYCPKHGSRFDIRTGAVTDYPATRPVKTYETKVEDGVVFVKV